MKETKELLQKLTEFFPPAEGCKHNLTFDGEHLELTLMLPDETGQARFRALSAYLYDDMIEVWSSADIILHIMRTFGKWTLHF